VVVVVPEYSRRPLVEGWYNLRDEVAEYKELGRKELLEE
jgi:hypothetical protein